MDCLDSLHWRYSGHSLPHTPSLCRRCASYLNVGVAVAAVVAFAPVDAATVVGVDDVFFFFFFLLLLFLLMLMLLLLLL